MRVNIIGGEDLTLDGVCSGVRADEVLRLVSERLMVGIEDLAVCQVGVRRWEYKDGPDLITHDHDTHVVVLRVPQSDYDLLWFKIICETDSDIKVSMASNVSFADLAAMYRLWSGVNDQRGVTFMNRDTMDIVLGSELLGSGIENDGSLMVMATAPGG